MGLRCSACSWLKVTPPAMDPWSSAVHQETQAEQVDDSTCDRKLAWALSSFSGFGNNLKWAKTAVFQTVDWNEAELEQLHVRPCAP